MANDQIAGGNQIPGFEVVERAGFFHGRIHIGFHSAYGHRLGVYPGAGIGSFDRVLHHVPGQRIDRFHRILRECLNVSRAAGALGLDRGLQARAGEQTGGQFRGGFFLQLAESFNGLQRGLVFAGKFLRSSLAESRLRMVALSAIS